ASHSRLHENRQVDKMIGQFLFGKQALQAFADK
ncbi:alpha/beta hydrolase, partial [Campylobacter jejuni]|nr:alpha/beta hydrolase [Campylobacter jejuni]